LILGAVVLVIILASIGTVVYRNRSRSVSKRILRYKRNALRGDPHKNPVLSDEDIISMTRRKRETGSISDEVYEDIAMEMGITEES
jgi:hypothetical protein